MKKIFTLLFTVGTIGVASAQSTPHHDSKIDSKSTVIFSNHGNEASFFSAREKDEMIRKINSEYDHKIEAVKWNRRLRNQEKARQIQMLNKQRAEEIRLVQVRFDKNNISMNNGHYNDHKGYRS